MTGYGRASRRTPLGSINVEVRSTNHRYLEIDQRLPNGCLAIQGRLAELIRRYVHRGRLDMVVHLHADRRKQRHVTFDESLMEGYHLALKRLKERFSLKGEVTLEQLLTLPHALTVSEEEEPMGKLEQPVIRTVQEAVRQLVQSRRKEGAKLLEDLRRQLQTIERLIRAVKDHMPKALIQQRQAVREKIQGLLGQSGSGSARLEEAVSLVKEADIHEELVRLESHLTHMRQTMGKGPLVGKQMDFIAQELMREANTMGAKVNDSQAAQWVVEIKGAIEKIREQSQNLE